MRAAAEFAVYLPRVLLLIALCGALISWAMSRLPLPVPPPLVFTGIASAMLFTLYFGVWSGFANPVDLNYFSIAGRVPYSDAGGYLTESIAGGYSGRWNYLPSTRPLAAAFRDLITAASALSYTRMMVIQVLLLSGALWFAMRSIGQWIGPWAALGFAGYVLIAARSFMGTAATEPLGLVWGVVAVAFLADALRTQALPPALLGLTCLTAALNTRAGALIVPAALLVWLFLFFGERGTRLRIAALGLLAFSAPAAVTLMLSALYGAKDVSIGWNFALSLCGLAKGTNWLGCNEDALRGGAPFASSAYAAELYRLAWDLFKAHPDVLIAGVRRGVVDYFTTAPWRMLSGYHGFDEVPAATLQKLSLLLLPGAVMHFYRAPFREWIFWLFAAAGMAASVGFIWESDGWRALYATHPLVALLFVTGLQSGRPSLESSPNWKISTAALCATACVLLAAPAGLHLFLASAPTDQYSGRAITGFVVSPDGASVPKDGPPHITATEFRKVIALAHLEPEWGPFVDRALAAAPFAMFWTTRIGIAQQGSQIFIGPADILFHPEVDAWRFVIEPPAPDSLSPNLKFVESSEIVR